jgi:hypothetical protein
MNDDSQATADTTSDAEPTVSETSTAIAPEPDAKKGGRGARSAKAAKAPKTEKSARARKAGKSEEAVAPVQEVDPEAVARKAKTRRLARTAKPTRAKAVEVAKVAKAAGTGTRAKSQKVTEAAKTAKPAKVAKASRKSAKPAPVTAANKPATVAAGGRGKGVRYTTNELNSAVKKAGLTVEFTPVVTKSANIGRGPAKEFKVDAIIAHLRGSNGDLIRDRGPGTPLHNDAESLAAVAIFEKFRGQTFHNKLKVEIL